MINFQQQERFNTLMIRLYRHDGCGVGGPLHVVVDDGNVGGDPDYWIEWKWMQGYSPSALYVAFEIAGFLSAFDANDQAILIENAHVEMAGHNLMGFQDDPRCAYVDGGPWVNGGEETLHEEKEK